MPISSLFGRIKRTDPDGHTVFFDVQDYKVAEYLHSLQDYGFKLQVIHEAKNFECEACSA